MVADGKDGLNGINRLVDDTSQSLIETGGRELDSIAYVDPADTDALKSISELYVDAVRTIAYGDYDESVYRTLTLINFRKLNDMAITESQDYPLMNCGKPKKWLDKECSLFLETHLLPVLLERFCIVNENLYFREVWGYWRKLGDASLTPKLVMVAALMIPAVPTLPSGRPIASLANLFERFARINPLLGDTTIQFNDCVITSKGELTQDAPDVFPRFIFDFDAWDAITSPTVVPEVDDLILHLANGDKAVAKCLIDRLSMTFVVNASKKAVLEPKAVMLYGPSGENGKSTFAKLLLRAMRDEHCETFSLSTFKDYELVKLRDNILLVDPDASSVHVAPEISTAMKTAITSDAMGTRQIYREAITTTPLCQFLICTNAMPKAEDKTRGWDRRLEWYEIDDKLVRDRDWFDALESREAADYLLSKLVNNAIALMARNVAIEVPEAVLVNNRGYAELNKNVSTWLECEVTQRGATNAYDAFNRVPSALLYESYENWCGENGETPFGITKFNQIIAGETGLRKKVIQIKAATDLEAFEWWQAHTASDDKFSVTKATIMCWVQE